jgi:uncharacterized phage infection (PIP) family protein YhgE
MRTVVIRLVAVLLIVNGVVGVMAVIAGWSTATRLMDGLRDSISQVTAQQARLVASVRAVAVGVDDASQATSGVSRSTTQVRTAVNDAAQTAQQLATTFDRLTDASRITVLGMRPLEGMTDPFSANASDFRQLADSLSATTDSLADNAREMTRVSDDLKTIRDQVSTAAKEVEALQLASFIQQGFAAVELGSRLLLGVIFFEATLSGLTGLALLLILGHARRATRG